MPRTCPLLAAAAGPAVCLLAHKPQIRRAVIADDCQPAQRQLRRAKTISNTSPVEDDCQPVQRQLRRPKTKGNTSRVEVKRTLAHCAVSSDGGPAKNPRRFMRNSDDEPATAAGQDSPKSLQSDSPTRVQSAPGVAFTLQDEALGDVPLSDLKAYNALVKRQVVKLKPILAELEEFGEKKSCWAWWVFPTEMVGTGDMSFTRVTEQTAVALSHNVSTATDWQAVLEKICELAEGGAGMRVLPSADRGRVHYFLKLWRRLDGCPDWMKDVCKRLSKFPWPPR